MTAASARIPLLTKAGYGAGQLVEGVKTAAFTFVFFYYTQVLGAPAGPVGVVLLVATLFDAITDPLMGAISDHTRHRWGRRHPYMYGAALPLAGALIAMFHPPTGAGPTMLLGWLLATTLLVRGTLTVVHVPYLALGADLSDDYAERTTIVAYRTAFGMAGLAAMLGAGWGWFFRATPEFANGQLNPLAYAGFAVACGSVAAGAIAIAAGATHRRIPALPVADSPPLPLTAQVVWSDWRMALSNRSFRALFFGLLAFGTMRGVQETLSIHLHTYFWQLSATQILGVFLVGITALVGAIPFWTFGARRVDKKPVLQAGVVIFTVPLVLMPMARIIGWFPAHEADLFLPLLWGGYGLAGVGASAVFVASGSMLADVVDEIARTRGHRLAGVIFGASALAFKVTTGLGGFLGGLALSVRLFPVGAAPTAVTEATSVWLGLVSGPIAGVFAIVTLGCFARYAIRRPGRP